MAKRARRTRTFFGDEEEPQPKIQRKKKKKIIAKPTCKAEEVSNLCATCGKSFLRVHECNTCAIFKRQQAQQIDSITLPKEDVALFLWSTIGARLRATMRRRERVSLPVKLRFSILPTVAAAIFPSPRIIITSATHAQQIFGDRYQVKYKRGSYAHISSKTSIICTSAGLEISLYFCVKNPEGVLQWGSDDSMILL